MLHQWINSKHVSLTHAFIFNLYLFHLHFSLSLTFVSSLQVFEGKRYVGPEIDVWVSVTCACDCRQNKNFLITNGRMERWAETQYRFRHVASGMRLATCQMNVSLFCQIYLELHYMRRVYIWTKHHWMEWNRLQFNFTKCKSGFSSIRVHMTSACEWNFRTTHHHCNQCIAQSISLYDFCSMI